VKFNIPDGEYKASDDEKYVLQSKVTVKDGRNLNELKMRFRSRWSQRMIDEEFEKGTTFWVKSGNFAIRAIYHEGKTANNSPRQIIFTNKNNSLCTYSRFNEKIGTSEEGTGELKDLFGGVSLFDYPKPVSLISYLCSLIYNEQDNKHSNDGIFLDFFAGSGTLAHAVINLNKKDNGTRKWICVQLPEILDESNGKTAQDKRAIKEKIDFLNSIKKPTNIAEISKERIRRVIKRENNKTGFKVFKLGPSNYPENTFEFDPDKSESENKIAFDNYLKKAKQYSLFNDDDNQIDVVFENIIKEGFSLNSKISEAKIGKNNVFVVEEEGRKLLICLDRKVDNNTVKTLTGSEYKNQVFICIDQALDDTDKANLGLSLELKTI
jgi:adenine-specific DNA-methyltransferase